MLEDLVSHYSHPYQWLNRASDLRAAAGAVWFSMQGSSESVREELGLDAGFSMPVACRPVYHMLCGLALEVLLKGVLAERGAPPPKTHDLMDLAADAGISFDDEERKLMRYYTDTIVWAGRYPLPLKPTNDKLRNHWDNAVDVLTSIEEINLGGWITTVSSSARADWPQFHRLYKRIRSVNGT